MVYKRVSKIIFAAILAVTVFSGCGNRQEEKIDKTETETTTQKSTQDSTQDVTQEAEEETKYPSITSDGKIKDYKSVVTVDCNVEGMDHSKAGSHGCVFAGVLCISGRRQLQSVFIFPFLGGIDH